MKKFFYALNLFLIFSLATHAMEEQPKNPLEALQKIAKRHIIFETYNPCIDFVHKDTTHYNSLPAWKTISQRSISLTDNQTKNPCYLNFSKNLNRYLLQFLGAKDIAQLGRTCGYFYMMTRPALYLNEYCLQERMPHSMPLGFLIGKVKSTPEGIFKLANLYSVSPSDLLAWFGQAYLDSVISKKELKLPESFQALSEKEQGEFYPVLKVFVAATPTHTEKNTLIQKMFDEEYHIRGLASFNMVRLRSIRADGSNHSHLLIEPLWFLQMTKHEEAKALIYKCLMGGHHVASTQLEYYNYCRPHPDNSQNEQMAIEIINWCCENEWDFANSYMLVLLANQLKQPQLGFKIILKLIDLPNSHQFPQDQFATDLLHTKIGSFVHYASDERVKEKISAFTQELYQTQWTTLLGHLKKDTLRLLIHTGQHESFKLAFAEFQNLKEFYDASGLLKDLYAQRWLEEEKQLIQLILENEKEDSLPGICDLGAFIDRAIQIFPEKTISILKKTIETPKKDFEYDSDKITALLCLAQHAKDTETQYILEKTSLLKGEEASNKIFIYYYLGEKELFKKSYYIHIEKLIEEESKKENSKTLKEFQNDGTNITSLEELRTCDPFEVIKKILERENAEKDK